MPTNRGMTRPARGTILWGMVIILMGLPIVSTDSNPPSHTNNKTEALLEKSTRPRSGSGPAQSDRNCTYLSGRQLTDCQCKASLLKASSVWSRGDVAESFTLVTVCNTSSPALRCAKFSWRFFLTIAELKNDPTFLLFRSQ